MSQWRDDIYYRDEKDPGTSVWDLRDRSSWWFILAGGTVGLAMVLAATAIAAAFS